MQLSGRSKSEVYWFWIGGVLMTGLALVPWWRNHDYLRDLYDYGGFMAANARLAAGERPYVDFGTPIQSAMFLFNSAAERMGGGTYLGMTWGVAVLAAIAIFGLGLMLARRWQAPLSMLVTGAVVICTVSQHTIILYNPLGVLALALVTWSFAVAPLLSRETVGWHLSAAAGLFLGGLTKLNFHLVACGMAAGWVLFAWTGQKSASARALATLSFILFFGLILPIATELAWTGATLRQWYHQVIELPLLTRGGRVSLLFSRQLYFTVVNDFYGPQRLPQTGLVGLWLAVIGTVAAWRNPGTASLGWRRGFIIGAGLAAGTSGAALLATNNEITYVALAASLVLATSLWLGFGAPLRGGWFIAGLLLPALLAAGLGWESAWRGQRSQFGHSSSPRTSYLTTETIGPDFAYLRGLHLPPDIVNSLQDTARWRQSLPTEMRDRIFYGPGLEWLDRIWPARKVRGLPLGQSAFVNGAREQALFKNEVLDGGTYHYVLISEAWSNWDAQVEQEFSHGFLKTHLGSVFFVYEKLPAQTVWARPLEFLPSFGGNANTMLLRSAMKVEPLPGGRRFLAVTEGHGEMKLDTPSYRASGEAVIKRTGTAVAGSVHFEIFAVNGEARYPRWSADVAVPEGSDEVLVPTARIDSSSLPLVFAVTVPDALAGKVLAGWRGPTLWDSIDGPKKPPQLVSGGWEEHEAWPAVLAAVLPRGLMGSPVFVRNAWVQDGALWMRPGGELWIHLSGLFPKITVVAAAKHSNRDSDASLHAVYYKGGRLDAFAMSPTKGGEPFRFNLWSPANDGWLGFIVDSGSMAGAFTVKIESVERR